jgi:benzoylformate decarboxylase
MAQLEGVDLILLLGVSNMVPLVYTGARMIPDGVKLIQVDINPRELGRNYPVDLALVADPATAAADLIESLKVSLSGKLADDVAGRREAVKSRIADARAKFAQSAELQADGPMPPAYVAREMRRLAAEDAILVDESVTSTAFVRTMFELSEPNSFFYAKGGSLGLGLPASVGVKLARPDRQVICSVGDGTAMYTLQGLWTAARYKLGVKFVVFNNSSYMILKGGLLAMRGASVERGVFTGMDITEPEIDFVKLAESMGLAARRAGTPAELQSALAWSFGLEEPTLVDVAIQREVRSVLR